MLEGAGLDRQIDIGRADCRHLRAAHSPCPRTVRLLMQQAVQQAAGAFAPGASCRCNNPGYDSHRCRDQPCLFHAHRTSRSQPGAPRQGWEPRTPRICLICPQPYCSTPNPPISWLRVARQAVRLAPSSRTPASRSRCAIQFRMAPADGSYSCANCRRRYPHRGWAGPATLSYSLGSYTDGVRAGRVAERGLTGPPAMWVPPDGSCSSPHAWSGRDGNKNRRRSAVLRSGAVLAFARLVDLVGALARPLATGAGAVPGGVQLVDNLRP